MSILALGLASGCGEVIEEPLESTPEADLVSQQEAPQEAPRKIEDLMGGLNHQEGILHVVDTRKDVVLRELDAVRVDATYYRSTNPGTGEVTTFRIKTYPPFDFRKQWKYCEGVDQWVTYWTPCPSVAGEDAFTRTWDNAYCTRKVQLASWGACVPSGLGITYRMEYLEAWKCGVAVGYVCTEFRSVRTRRYDYKQSCDGPLLSVTASYDWLCSP